MGRRLGFLSQELLREINTLGAKSRDLPYVLWIGEYALHQCQEAYRGVIQNLPMRPAAWLLRFLAFPFGARWSPPGDALTIKAARGILDGGEAREHLTTLCHIPPTDELGLGTLELALEFIQEDELIEVTPDGIRLRKREMDANKRRKAAKAAAAAG